MTPHLRKRMEELAEKYARKECDHKGFIKMATADYIAGFTACHNTLMPVIKDLVEALEFYSKDVTKIKEITDLGISVDTGERARAVLEKHKGVLE